MLEAKHACRRCGQSGHRQETCPSIAGQIIRDLKAQLGQRAARAGKERRLRRVRKDGKLKAQAKQSNSPTAENKMQGSEVRRGDVEALRDLLKDPAQCVDKLVADGLCDTHRHCSHCGSGEVRRSQCQRGVRKGHFFVSCAKCHKYTNCLFYSKVGPLDSDLLESRCRSGCARVEALLRQCEESKFSAPAESSRSSSWHESLPMPCSTRGHVHSGWLALPEHAAGQAGESAGPSSA